jgi:hypothetical protein
VISRSAHVPPPSIPAAIEAVDDDEMVLFIDDVLPDVIDIRRVELSPAPEVKPLAACIDLCEASLSDVTCQVKSSQVKSSLSPL